MARSTTVWAAALVLASFSGSGPMLTTAEAMPAPGPQETQGRPRYYFPRHVKRQIVTNSTAPAAPTSSSAVLSSSSSSEQLESRQMPGRVSSFVESLFGNRPDSSSNLFVSKSDADLTSTVTSIQEVIVTPVPDRSERLSGTGNLRQTPSSAQSSAGSVEQAPPPPSSSNTGSRDRSSDAVVVSPSPAPTPSPLDPEEQPEVVPSSPSRVGSTGASPPASRSEPNNPLLGTIGTIPAIVVPPTSAVPSSGPLSSSQPQVVIQTSSVASPSAGLPSEIVQPSPSSQAAGNLLSTLLGGVAGPTGVLPSSVVQPTPTPESPVSSPVPASSVSVASSFLGPFIVPGSSEGLSSTVVQPSPTQGLLGSLLSSVLDSQPTPSPQIGSTGVLPSSIVSPTSGAASPSSDSPLVVLPSSGIVVGITTALGTGAPTPTPSSPLLSSGAIPTSEAASPSSGPLNLPSILSSLVSEVSGILPSGSAGPTAPTTPSPIPTPSGVVPPVISSLVSEVSSLLSSAVPDLPTSVVPSILSSLLSGSPVPSATVPILPPASSVASSVLTDFSSGLLPTPTAPVSTPVTTPVTTPIVPSETPSAALSPSPSASLTPSGSIETPGVTPSASLSPSGSVGSGVVPTPTPSASGTISVPTSEVPVSSGLPSSAPIISPSANATASEVPVTSRPSNSASVIDSATIPIPTTPSISSKPTAVQSLRPIGSDSATSIVIPTSIIQESTSNAAASPTSSGIPSALPRIIAPPGGIPNDVSTESFMGQVCFKWPLNYPFVAQNDGGRQIFHYLPKAVANGLNISESEVRNMGLRPLDTTQYQGFITTLAYFTIPKDLQTKLQAQLRNPADPFWHSQDQTVNDLTDLINTACPLPAGKLPGDSSNPNQAANPAATNSGGASDGGALGGDIGASRPINGSAAGIATGAIVGAIAYGAAMFFVARRYRNKRIAHSRSSSVPSTGSRMTYGSIPGGAAAWMHGARNGRITPGSRGSQGSSSSQGRSVRTQQISAPVMAENSLGWN